MDSSREIPIPKEDYEKQHTFFPEDVAELTEEIKTDLDVDVRIIANARIGNRHVIYPEVVRHGGHPDAVRLDHDIYIFPEFSILMKDFFARYPGEAKEFTRKFLDRSKDFKRQHAQEYPKFIAVHIPEFHQAVHAFIGSKELEYLEPLIEELDKVRGQEPSHLTYLLEVLMPLYEEFPQLRELTAEQLKPRAYHEAGHVMIGEIGDEYLLTDEDVTLLNELFTPEVQEELRNLTPNILDEDPEAEVAEKLRNQGMSKLEYILQRVDDTDLKKRMAFTFLWRGVHEDMARALSYWKTSDEYQLYNNSTLVGYFGPIGMIIFQGNEGIRSYAKFIEENGVAAFKNEIENIRDQIFGFVSQVE